MRPTKIQISLGIRPVWSVFTVRMKKHWVLGYPLSAQGRMMRLGRCPGWFVFAWCTRYFIGFVMLQINNWAATWQNQQNECAPSEDSDQPGHSLSAWRKLGSLATHWAQSEDWSDWADAQADLSLRWAHTHFVGFVMSWLIFRTVTGSIWLQDRTAP